jgi:ferredoxin--NADP+ reductase
MREIILALDTAQLDQEIERIAPNLREIGQDPDALKAEMRKPLEKAESFESPTTLRFRFLVSTSRLIPDENGRLAAVEITHNRLTQKGERLNAQATEQKEILPLDTLIFAIGDQVDPKLGLPEKWGQYLTPSAPHPVDPERPRYDLRRHDADAPREGWFLGGWARIASDGLVGKARMDGESAAQEVLTWLEAHPPASPRSLAECKKHLHDLLQKHHHPFVDYADVQRLEAIEAARAKAANAPLFKFNTNEEMLDALKGS